MPKAFIWKITEKKEFNSIIIGTHAPSERKTVKTAYGNCADLNNGEGKYMGHIFLEKDSITTKGSELQRGDEVDVKAIGELTIADRTVPQFAFSK